MSFSYSWEAGELRRRRIRNPTAKVSTKAATARVGRSIAAIGLLCPANPTRITPVLVTPGAGLVPAGPPMPLADGDGVLCVGVGVVPPDAVAEPPVLPVLPVRVGAAYVGGGATRLGGSVAGMLGGGWVVAGAVVGFAAPADTTMSTEGLPEPQLAVTV
jgi:hypothetical protein